MESITNDNENPLGQIINAGSKREIAGVVGNVKPRGLELESKPQRSNVT